jgi:hypothetical protein
MLPYANGERTQERWPWWRYIAVSGVKREVTIGCCHHLPPTNFSPPAHAAAALRESGSVETEGPKWRTREGGVNGSR